MLGSVFGGLGSLSKLKGSTNDDWIDRMNHLWTVCIFALFAIVVSTGQYVGDPIHCWAPAEFTGAYVDYTKYICWISNTYHVPMPDVIPVDIQERQDREITYYQWVPLILLFQAFMFKIPNIVWRLFNNGSGVNLDKIVNMSEQTQLGSPKDREETIEHIAKYMDRWLETHREYHWNLMVRLKQGMAKYMCCFCNKRAGTYLTAFYITVKALYLANVIGQFFLLNAFMANDYNLFGFEVLDYLAEGGKWVDSPRFPRVTLCDFQIRQLQNIQRFTVQCVLPINLFNEKIFIFIWFWLFFVAVLTGINFIVWCYRIIFKRNRAGYVKKFLKLTGTLSSAQDKRVCQKFADEYLRDDGIFVVRVIGKNSTDLVVCDLVNKLWSIYSQKPSTRKNNEMDSLDDDHDEKESLA